MIDFTVKNLSNFKSFIRMAITFRIGTQQSTSILITIIEIHTYTKFVTSLQTSRMQKDRINAIVKVKSRNPTSFTSNI